MFKKSLVSAAVAACVGLSLVASVVPAHANLVWGQEQLVVSSTIAAASALAFNQFNPIVVNSTTSVPATASNTSYAVDVVNNVNGSTKLVLMLRYSNGSVYAFTSDDLTTASQAAGVTDTVTVTDAFSFATVNGQTVVQQTLYVNGTMRHLVWGNGDAGAKLVSALTMGDGSCRQLSWGGTGLTQSGNSGGGGS